MFCQTKILNFALVVSSASLFSETGIHNVNALGTSNQTRVRNSSSATFLANNDSIPNSDANNNSNCGIGAVVSSLLGGMIIGAGSVVAVLQCGGCLNCSRSEAPNEKETTQKGSNNYPPEKERDYHGSVKPSPHALCTECGRLYRNHHEDQMTLPHNDRHKFRPEGHVCPDSPQLEEVVEEAIPVRPHYVRPSPPRPHTPPRPTPYVRPEQIDPIREEHFGEGSYPVAAAPVDYVYNLDDFSLSVELAAKGSLVLEKPVFSSKTVNKENGNFIGTWNVETAGSDGEMKFLDGNNVEVAENGTAEKDGKVMKNLPFLWWESKLDGKDASYPKGIHTAEIIPALRSAEATQQFFVKKDKNIMKNFFNKTLFHVGLNETEIGHFSSYWLHALGLTDEESDLFKLDNGVSYWKNEELSTGNSINKPTSKESTYVLVHFIIDDYLNNLYARTIAKTTLSKEVDFSKTVFCVFTEVEDDLVEEMAVSGKIARVTGNASLESEENASIEKVLGARPNRPDEKNGAKVFVEWGGMVADLGFEKESTQGEEL